MIEWIRSHEVLLWWLVVVSLVTFVGTILGIPFLVARIPTDYFARRRRRLRQGGRRHPALRIALIIGKNFAGMLFVLAGIAMLFLPGQGVITILIGILLMDFPGKFALERWLIGWPSVLRGINWLRERARRPPLEVPGSASPVTEGTEGEEK